MNTVVDVLESQFDVLPHHPDTIDQVAVQRAYEIIELTAEEIQSHKAIELVKIFDKLNAQYAMRRVGNTVHVGDIISESTSFATRTADWAGLDEIFTIETIYEPVLKKPLSRYSVEMLEQDGGKTVMVLNPDGSMVCTRVNEGVSTRLDDEAMDSAMLDLVLRAEVAVGAYEMRKEAAAEEGLDPRSYSDKADKDARTKLLASGYEYYRATTME